MTPEDKNRRMYPNDPDWGLSLVGKRGLLVNGKVICPGDEEWLRQWSNHMHYVFRDVIEGWVVSTIFLGIDPGSLMAGPMWFETVIFDSTGKEVEKNLHSTYELAQISHQYFIQRVKMKLAKLEKYPEDPEEARAHNRPIFRDELDGHVVSTLFLSVPCKFFEEPSYWFKTWTYTPDGKEQEHERYETYEEAKAGHERHVAQMREK